MSGQHLSPEEIDASFDQPGTPQPSCAEHVGICSECQQALAAYGKKRESLYTLIASMPGRQQPSCPKEEEWIRLAAGLVETPAAERLLAHASNCDVCAGELRKAAECFSRDLTSDEQDLLERLQSSRPEWQQDIARRMVRKRNVFSIRPGIRAWIAIAAGVLIAFGMWWMLRGPTMSGTADLLASAYSAQRKFDLRVPGAKYTVLTLSRGTSAEWPKELLEADLRTRTFLARHPDDVNSLDLKGRAALLELNTETAIQALHRAKALAPENATVDADLGCAYALRGELENRPSDFAQAVEFLHDALKKDPQFAVAAFNLALTYEKLNLNNQAEDAWRKYLAIDPASAWSQKAKSHLDEIVKKKSGANH